MVDTTAAPDASAANPYRLPRDVVPRRYELTLAPDLDAATFSGTVAAAVDVVAATDTIVLNAAELDIDEAWVEIGDGGGDGLRLTATVTLDEETERATLALPSQLAAGTATVHLRFRGTLNDKLRGFYRSTFTDESGTERVLACTQMESTDARRAFPCWDEPDFKAVFGVTLVVADGLLAISNGAEVSRATTDDGRVAVRFADTIPMSSYLVAFVVGPLEATAEVDVDGTPLRIVHPLGKSELTAFALEVGAFCLRYFGEWFAIDYPGDKLDLVAIPDFAFGAMENLGCITFRERLLLIDPATSTKAERQAVVDVIAHEIAHMWFGDLVTMKWWNGIWLNEAFATFMEMKATDAFRPDWQRWVDFGLSRSVAFDTDTLVATRPIEFPVVSPADADGMFDVLTYEKGASVVRMLEQYLGEEGFRGGLRRYMDRHKLGNTETTDLWDALEEETGQPVRRIADSWIFQGGYPGVAAELVGGAGSGGASVLRLSQSRFLFSPADHGERWAVPLVVGARTNGDTSIHKVLLDEDIAELTLPASAEWINANLGANGFYRVTYSDDLRARLVEQRADLSPLERYVLVDDTLAGVLAGTVEASAFLDLADHFSDEADLSVWERLIGGLGTLDRVVDDGSARDAFAARVRSLLAPVRARLGDGVRADDDDRTRTLRGLLAGSAATLGDDADALALCRGRLDAYLDSPSSVDPSLASAALSASATHGDVALHDRLVEAFRGATNPQDRERFLFSLARFRDAAAAQRTLDLALSGEVRTQDAPYLLREAIANRDNGPTAWHFVTDHWDELLSKFPHNSLSRMVSGIRTIRDPALAASVEAFLDAHPLPTGEMQVRQHLERMNVTVALAERESSRLAAALG